MYTYENTKLYGEDTANKLLISLLKDGDTTLLPGKGFPYAGNTDAKNAWADRERGKTLDNEGPLAALLWTRSQSEEEKLFKQAQRVLNTYGYHKSNNDIAEPALIFMPGAPGKSTQYIMELAGAYHVGKGVRQIADGNTWEGAGNAVQGALMASGGGWASKVVGKPSGGIISPESKLIQENSWVLDKKTHTSIPKVEAELIDKESGKIFKDTNQGNRSDYFLGDKSRPTLINDRIETKIEKILVSIYQMEIWLLLMLKLVLFNRRSRMVSLLAEI